MAISPRALSIKDRFFCISRTFSRMDASSLSCNSRASSFAVFAFSRKVKNYFTLLNKQMKLRETISGTEKKAKNKSPGFFVDFPVLLLCSTFAE